MTVMCYKLNIQKLAGVVLDARKQDKGRGRGVVRNYR
jgi:hypothetical protein